MDIEECKSIVRTFINTDLKKIVRSPNAFVRPFKAISERSRLAGKSKIELTPSAFKRSEYSSAETRMVLGFLENATGWIPANPNKNSVKNRIVDSYAPLTKSSDARAANAVDDKGGFKFEEIIKQHNRVLLSGVRGIGKTAFLNYWLSLNSSILEKQNITWFRVDASKVHKIHETRQEAAYILYTDYMRLHLVYVVMQYGSALQENIHTKSPADKSSAMFEAAIEFAKVTNNSIYSDVRACLKDIIRATTDKHADHPDLSRLIVNKLASDKELKPVRKIFKSLFDIIIHYFNKERIRCVLIIDGIDNIPWTKRNQFYSMTCKQFGKIVNSFDRDFGSNTSIVLAARPETIDEISNVRTAEQVGFNSLSIEKFYTCEIVPPPIDEIVERKISAAKESDSFLEMRSEFASTVSNGGSILSRELASISLEIPTYSSRIVRTITESYRHLKRLGHLSNSIVANTVRQSSLDNNSVLNILFDNDIRAYIDNIIKTYYVSRRPKLSKNKDVGRWLMQYVFMNGEPFFDSFRQYLTIDGVSSRSNHDARGSVFPNIFWWDTETTRRRPQLWHGLSGVRVLQLLKATREISAGDVIFFLSQTLHYEVEVIVECIESFVAFGLIDLISQNSRKEFVFKGVEGDIRIRDYVSICKITDKGEFIYEYIWCRPDVMYYYALDTPLSYSMVESDHRYVRACRVFGSLDFVEDFFKSAIPTLSTFYLHILTQVKVDQLKIEKRGEEDKLIQLLFDSVEDVVNAFKLPDWNDEFFIKFVEVGMSPRRDKSTVEEIMADIVGVLNK
jgi:hypothetical protein